ncbi:hypothetical protein ScPMuIL_006612 [Solemya velum]
MKGDFRTCVIKIFNRKDHHLLMSVCMSGDSNLYSYKNILDYQCDLYNNVYAPGNVTVIAMDKSDLCVGYESTFPLYECTLDYILIQESAV